MAICELRRTKEELTQRLKLHFKKGRDCFRSDGKESDPSNPDGAYDGPSDNGEDRGTRVLKKEKNLEKVESVRRGGKCWECFV